MGKLRGKDMNCCEESCVMSLNTHVVMGSKNGTFWRSDQQVLLVKPCRVAVLVRDGVAIPSGELEIKVAHLVERIAHDVLCRYNDLQYIKGMIVQLLKKEFDGLVSGMVYGVVREGDIDFVVDCEKEIDMQQIEDWDKRAFCFVIETLRTCSSIERVSNNRHLVSVCLTGFMCTAFLSPKQSELEV